MTGSLSDAADELYGADPAGFVARRTELVKEARAAKDFARSDALRDDLAARGVEVMDGDPLGWEWKLG